MTSNLENLPSPANKSRWKKIWDDNKLPLLIILPPALLFLVLFHLPVLFGIWYSFTDWNGVDLHYNFIAFRNYADAFTSTRFWNALFFSIKYAIICSGLINFGGLFFALLLNQKLRYKKFFRGLFFFPAVLSLLTIGFIFNQFFYLLFPRVGELLNIEILKTNILGNQDLAIWGIVLVNVWQNTALTIVIYLAGLQAVPESIYESAIIDGAGSLVKLVKITLPMIIPAITTNLILSLKGGLTVFDYIMVMTGGGPGKATESITIFIYDRGFGASKLGYGSAASVILFVLFAAISVIQIAYMRKREVEL